MDQHVRRAILWRLPDLFSASRIAAALLLAVAVLALDAPVFALALAIWAALSDALDGFAARANGSVSDFGARLDPVADKVFVLTALWLLLGEGVIQGGAEWAALIVLWREILILGLRNFVRASGAAASTSAAARFKTGMQFLAVIALFAARTGLVLPDLCQRAGLCLLWLAAALALYSGLDYISRAWRGSWK